MLALNKALVERPMDAAMNMHLGYRLGEAKPADQDNARNGVRWQDGHQRSWPDSC